MLLPAGSVRTTHTFQKALVDVFKWICLAFKTVLEAFSSYTADSEKNAPQPIQRLTDCRNGYIGNPVRLKNLQQIGSLKIWESSHSETCQRDNRFGCSQVSLCTEASICCTFGLPQHLNSSLRGITKEGWLKMHLRIMCCGFYQTCKSGYVLLCLNCTESLKRRVEHGVWKVLLLQCRYYH